MTNQLTSTTVTVEHVTLSSTKSLEAVRSALEASVPAIDLDDAKLLKAGDVDEARGLLERQAPLSIFGSRDHGDVLLTAGLSRKVIQYDIGNPLMAASMTWHNVSAASYAPIRMLLREDAAGGVAFEHDRPASTFDQFGNPPVDAVTRKLDDLLRSVLAAVAE